MSSMKKFPFASIDLLQMIADMRSDRISYAKIGEACGLTRQRIYQIVKAYNIASVKIVGRGGAQRFRTSKDSPMPEQWLWDRLKYRASGQVRVDLFDSLKDKLPSHCPILGTELVYQLHGRVPSKNTPSLDRVDNTKGYIVGNTAVISRRANTLKSDMSRAVLARLLEYIDSNVWQSAGN